MSQPKNILKLTLSVYCFFTVIAIYFFSQAYIDKKIIAVGKIIEAEIIESYGSCSGGHYIKFLINGRNFKLRTLYKDCIKGKYQLHDKVKIYWHDQFNRPVAIWWSPWANVFSGIVCISIPFILSIASRKYVS